MPHIHELYDFTISVFIVNDSAVLLVNHPRYNRWLPIGGHIELHEDPQTAIYREVEEECGLTINLLTAKPAIESPGTTFMPTPNYLDVHEANAPHKHISLTYFATSDDRNATLSKEHTELRWFTTQELRAVENISPAVLFYCEQAIAASQA